MTIFGISIKHGPMNFNENICLGKGTKKRTLWAYGKKRIQKVRQIKYTRKLFERDILGTEYRPNLLSTQSDYPHNLTHNHKISSLPGLLFPQGVGLIKWSYLLGQSYNKCKSIFRLHNSMETCHKMQDKF